MVSLGSDDGNIGRHAGPEFEVGIVHGDDRVVGDDILIGLGGIADLNHVSMKDPRRVGVHIEVDRLVGFDAADIGFRDQGVNLHLTQIIGNLEQDGRAEARRNSLADINITGNDNAIDGRINRGIGEVDLRLAQRGYLDRNLGRGLMESGRGGVVIRLCASTAL